MSAPAAIVEGLDGVLQLLAADAHQSGSRHGGTHGEMVAILRAPASSPEHAPSEGLPCA